MTVPKIIQKKFIKYPPLKHGVKSELQFYNKAEILYSSVTG